MGERLRAVVAAKFGRQAGQRDAAEEVARWLNELRVVIPEPEPVAFRSSDMAVIPADEATDDDLVIQPDHPTIDDLAHAVVGITRDADETYPGPWSPSRWERLHKAVGRLDCVLPVTFSRCASLDGADPVGGWRFSYQWPRWSTFYVLGKPRWWWECHRRQGLTLRRHAPAYPFAFGICARCAPCPECGAPYDCADDCTSLVPDPSEAPHG